MQQEQRKYSTSEVDKIRAGLKKKRGSFRKLSKELSFSEVTISHTLNNKSYNEFILDAASKLCDEIVKEQSEIIKSVSA